MEREAADAVAFCGETIMERLEEAGRTLIAMPGPQRGRPLGVRSTWPEIAQQSGDIFAAIIGSENPEEKAKEIEEARNRIRIRPSAAEVRRMDECLGWLWWVEPGITRRVVFARMLVHPVTDRYLASWSRLRKLTGLHVDTLKARQAEGISQILRGLRSGAARSSPGVGERAVRRAGGGQA